MSTVSDRSGAVEAQRWLDQDVGAVAGRWAKGLRALGVETNRDLVEYYPHSGKYRDIGAHLPVAEAPLGEQVTLVGTITSWSVARPRPKGGRQGGRPGRGLVIAKAKLRDDAGGFVEIPLFNQEWRVRAQPAGTRVAASGVLERFRTSLQLRNAKVTVLGEVDEFDDADRIVATYPATEAMPSPRIAALVAAALEQMPPLVDHLPAELRRRHELIDLDAAVRQIHKPADLIDVKPARERLVYDELLCLQIGLQQRRHRLESDAVGLEQMPKDGGYVQRLADTLPFAPTGAQQRAFAEIDADLLRPKPMHRLLQGDVGSGKTLVAAHAMLRAVDAGRQAVLMAPTEVLAEQHLRTFSALLAPLGVNVLDGPRLALLTGSTTAKVRRQVLAELAVGDIHLLVGTHALLTEHVMFDDLGVVVVDEQHRFGVEHRARLRDKRSDERTPDVLVMTATPIPRSLALTLYGDLDVTILDELPPGRQQIVTQVIESDSPRRDGLYAFIRERVAAGERAYVVCPLVEESDVLENVAAAEQIHALLSQEVFGDLDVALVHGRLTAAERDAAMEAFRKGAAQILVATTVIEVGVDVPEATIMVIEDADRFGISQLHQLRGRVGRGSSKSYCVLFSSNPEGNARLEALAATTDGFELAETDLALRGEGSLFDTRQSGLPDLKLAKLIRDRAWIAATRSDARDLVAADPELTDHPDLVAEVRRRYGEERLAELKTG